MKRAPEWLHVVVYLLIGGLLLVLWPFGAMASVMGIAAPITPGATLFSVASGFLFHMGILMYPLVFVLCLVASVIRTGTPNAEPNSVGTVRLTPSFFAGLPILYAAAVFSIMLLAQLLR